jgi:hypothetical protein
MTTDLLLVCRFVYTIDSKNTIHKRYFSALWRKISALKKIDDSCPTCLISNTQRRERKVVAEQNISEKKTAVFLGQNQRGSKRARREVVVGRFNIFVCLIYLSLRVED